MVANKPMAALAFSRDNVQRSLGIAIVLLALSHAAFSQVSADFDFGLRGGAFNGGIPIEVPNNHEFPDLYSSENLPFTFGPTVGILLNDHWKLRFEAVRSRFRFHDQSGIGIVSGSTYTSTTDGHVWQYPVLLAYHAGIGTVRPFGGGGVSLGSTFGGTTQTVTTRILPNPNGPNPVTTISTAPFKLESMKSPMTFYITGGIEGRFSIVSIRPEFRYGHWINWDMRSDSCCQDDTILFSANQIEFLIGITVHPFSFKH